MDLFKLGSYVTHHMAGELAFLFLGLSTLSIRFLWGSGGRWETFPHSPATLAALTVIVFGLADLLLFAALPLLGLSFGLVLVGVAWLTVIRMAVWLVIQLSTALIVHFRPGLHPFSGLLPLWIANLSISAFLVYAMYVEPFELPVTRIRLTTPKIPAGKTIRIVQLTDIHVERITRRERAMLDQVRILQPDLVLLTGDYLNIDYTSDPLARKDGKEVLAQLSAPYGVYAIPGSHGVDIPSTLDYLFDGPRTSPAEGSRRTLPTQDGGAIQLLEDEIAPITVDGVPMDLVGVTIRPERDNAPVMENLMQQVPTGGYTVLLYHTPDLAYVAEQAGVDLYLAGHTHGGQIRIPFYGALITMSDYGKRFEAGLFQLDGTTMYVSRGIGMEGLRLPRMRFLCPPEIVVLELSGK